METAQDGNTILLKLSDGEDLVPSLEAAAWKHNVESGAVLWGIGMIQDFEIGFFGPKGYEKTTFAERHELLALHGSIAMRGDPKLHLHVAAGRRDHAVIVHESAILPDVGGSAPRRPRRSRGPRPPRPPSPDRTPDSGRAGERSRPRRRLLRGRADRAR